MADQLAAAELARLALSDRSEQLRWAAARLPLAGDPQAVPDARLAARRLREVWTALPGHLEPDSKGPRRRLRRLAAELRPLEQAEARLRLLGGLLGPPQVAPGGAPPQAALLAQGREADGLRALLEAASLEEARIREQTITRRLLLELETAAGLGVPAPGVARQAPAVQLARVQLAPLFEAAARGHRKTAAARRRDLWRLLHRLELFAPALSDQHQVVLAEIRRLSGLLDQLRDRFELVEWVDQAAKRGAADLRPALRRLVVRAELEMEAAGEVAELELRSLDAGGWWRTALLACLPERRRSAGSPGR